jgi:hypothetical protein
MPADLVEGLADQTRVYAADAFDSSYRSRPRREESGRDSGVREQTYDYDIDLFDRRTWTGGRRAAPGTAESPPSRLKQGMRVRHAQFGDGIILSRERVGNDVKLVITFSRVGRKTLIEKYAKLQAI